MIIIGRPSNIDWSNLAEDYAELGCQSAVAKKYRCSQTRIWQKMKEMNIPANFNFYGNRNNNWRGGRRKTNWGYIYVCSPDHPYRNKRGEVAEHRLVMEKILGRYLEPHEIVHHINGVRDDNRPENLELTNMTEHQRTKHPKRYRDKFMRFHNSPEKRDEANNEIEQMKNIPTSRQSEVLILWQQGCNRQQIADKTNMTRKNVHFHLMNLFKKGLIPEFRTKK